MAFKRYIHKHGKKLGPYYYENIRGPDGKVKTVYIGTNPNQHPKHRIRKPLFFLILVLILILILGGSLFLLQNKAYLIKRAGLQQADFEVDQILLKVLVRSGEFIEKQIRVMNTGSGQADINVEASGLSDIVKAGSNSFAIKPGQTKIVNLNFSSFVDGQNIEQQPGIYVGKLIVKSEKASKEVPVVVEIESKQVLFDMNLNPVAIERRVKQGSDTTIEIRLFNLQSIESANADVEYFVKDINGNTIVTETETVVVKTQASFFKTVSIPKNLEPGPYVFAAAAKFGNSIGTASYLFEVTGPEEQTFLQFCKNSILCMGLSLTTMLLLFALTAYFYFFVGAYLYGKVTGIAALPGKRKEKEEIERLEEAQPSDKSRKFYKILDEAKEAIDNSDVSEVNEFYIEARDLYVDLADQEKQEAYDKLMELYKRRNILAEEKERQGELRKKGELRRQKVKGFFRKIGLYKTIEEKRQIGLQKEKEKEKRKQEELKREEKLMKQKELEEKQKERQRLAEERKARSEARKKQLEEAKRLQEEQSRQQELKRKQEQERKKEELEAKKREEERKIKKEEEERQKELERQRQEQAKARKLALIKQIEEKLRKNEVKKQQLNSELKRIESEEKILLRKTGEIDAELDKIDNEIIEKSKQSEELSSEKNSLFENCNKQLSGLAEKQESEKAEKSSKIKELKAGFSAKQEALTKGLEAELSRLSPAKRKKTEKWRRMELKARLKLDRSNFEEEIEKLESAAAGEKKAIEDNYRKSLQEINKKRNEIKQQISGLESQKEQALLEKGSVPKELRSNSNQAQKIRRRLEILEKERRQLNADLLRVKSELSKFRGFFSAIISGYKENAQKRKEAKKELKMLRQEAKLRREEAKGKAKEEKIKIEKPKETERLAEEKKPGKKPGLLEKMLKKNGPELKSEPEEKPKPELQVEKKIIGKGKNLERFYSALNEAKESIEKGDVPEAGNLYAKARKLYVNLPNNDKKEVYDELMELYNMLKKQ